jgi:adenylate cyclase
MSPTRRLAAILAADVVGYSRLMQADEAGTLTSLKARRTEILQPLIATHHGRIVKVMGDGVLVEFASAVNAVTCAVALQEAMDVANADLPEHRRIVLRVGINLGDVMVEGSDLYGDGVNIAARLEALAEPGSVFISQTVFAHVKGKANLDFEDLGERSLKNMAEPVRVYRLSGSLPTGAATATGGLPSKPSIAVLPFTNMSDDRDQEYFSDGVTEDITMDLSQVSSLFVAARNSAFTFKGKAVEVVEAARKLNVGYVLEGSVRKAGNRIRIVVQLIDGATGGHIWAQRYDRDLGDIFALQDDISKSVVSALSVKLLPAEMKTITSRPTRSVEAYQRYLQARSIFHMTWLKSHLKTARQLFVEATEIDPGYARAYAGIADCDAFSWFNGDSDISYDQMLANSSKAMELAPNLAEAHASRGLALYLSGHAEEARSMFDKAIALDSELFSAHFLYGASCRDTGQFEKAVRLLERAADLSRDDIFSLCLLADLYNALGRRDLCDQAARRMITRAETVLKQYPGAADTIAAAAATMVFLGENEYERAEEWVNRALSLEPENHSVRYNAAGTFAVIGKLDAALECLEYIHSGSPRARGWLLGILSHDTQFESLRGRPDFEAFVRRLKADVAEHSS